MRLFRKYFFKLYHLFRFLGIFIFIFMLIPNVKADTYTISDIISKLEFSESCSNNLLEFDFESNLCAIENNRNNYKDCPSGSYQYPLNKYYLELKENTSYYFYVSGSNLNSFAYASIRFFNENWNFISDGMMSANASFNTPSNTKYAFVFYYARGRSLNDIYSYLSNYSFGLFEGSSVSEYVSYEECQELPDTPVDVHVEIAQPTDTNPETIFASFYTLFFNKLKFLNDSFLDNKILLGFIGVIVIFVILELFLKLFNGGGYKRK